MNEKIGFFEELPGQKSSTRLNSFILLIGFLIINGLYFYNAPETVDMNFIIFDFMMLLGIFAPKYLHKLAEKDILKQ